MKAFVVAFCGIFLAAPAIAQPSGSTDGNGASASNRSDAPASANQRGDAARDPRQICRRIDSGTSRRLGTRLVCHTAAEWRDIQDNS